MSAWAALTCSGKIIVGYACDTKGDPGDYLKDALWVGTDCTLADLASVAAEYRMSLGTIIFHDQRAVPYFRFIDLRDILAMVPLSDAAAKVYGEHLLKCRAKTDPQ